MDTAPIQSTFLANRPAPDNELETRLEAMLSGPDANTDENKRLAHQLNARIHALRYMKRELAKSTSTS